jgi:hypothetical protein
LVTQDRRQKELEFKASLDIIIELLSQKQNKHKRAGGVVQVVEHLPSEHETLGSVPNTTGGEKKRRKFSVQIFL